MAQAGHRHLAGNVDGRDSAASGLFYDTGDLVALRIGRLNGNGNLGKCGVGAAHDGQTSLPLTKTRNFGFQGVQVSRQLDQPALPKRRTMHVTSFALAKILARNDGALR